MRATGLVRRVDDFGRFLLPKELRDRFGLDEGTPMEVLVDDDAVVLRKYEPGCALCNGMDGLRPSRTGKLVCVHCAASIASTVVEGKS